jgi:signal transduction histidine kinase
LLVIIAFFDVLFFGLLLTKPYFETYKKNDILQLAIIENQTQTIQSIAEAQIRERKQIANIIHDHFGSKLTHILHLLELENHSLAKKNIRELTKEMRDVSHQILPKSLESGAFLSDMKNQVKQFNEGLSNSKIELQSFDFLRKNG